MNVFIIVNSFLFGYIIAQTNIIVKLFCFIYMDTGYPGLYSINWILILYYPGYHNTLIVNWVCQFDTPGIYVTFCHTWSSNRVPRNLREKRKIASPLGCQFTPLRNTGKIPVSRHL
jgi:hypothetical protein